VRERKRKRKRESAREREGREAERKKGESSLDWLNSFFLIYTTSTENL